MVLMKVRVSVPIGSLCLTRVLDNVTIISITTVRVTIAHEMANAKAVLQAILVQILTVALKLVLCQIQIQYERLNQYFSYILSTLVFILIKMINMCANTNTNTTIVTTLSTQVPTLCRFSTSDAVERGGFEWASCYQCFGTCKLDGICLESAEMSRECRDPRGGVPQPYIYVYL